jgi:methylated-DNA-[protein]-cysteine S-methyltransferase
MSTNAASTTYFTVMPSPVGRLTLVGENEQLLGIYFENAPLAAAPPEAWARDDHRLAGAVGQLEEYFAGARTGFNLPLAPRGTPFQQTVWAELLRIPFGETRSYGQLAHAVGKPTASRAVGAANGRNPLSIVIPCHRVIGADGSLTGYGGHVSRKVILLDHEARLAARGPLKAADAGGVERDVVEP